VSPQRSFCCLRGSVFAANTDIRIVEKPGVEAKNDFYISNGSPLLPSPLIRLPVGSIEPKGWVRRQLELQRDGFPWTLDRDQSVPQERRQRVAQPCGRRRPRMEEPPYWLKGFSNCGYILRDSG